MAMNAMKRVVTLLTTLWVQLKGDSWAQATPQGPDHYTVWFAEDPTTAITVPATEVVTARPVNQGLADLMKIGSTPTRKEDRGMIYHYLTNPKEDVVVRHVATADMLTNQQLDAYEVSMRLHRPINGLMAISTGSWEFHLLKNRAESFHLKIVSNGDFTPSELMTVFAKSNFAWANADYSFFMEIPGQEGWGLHGLGLFIADVAKASKRLQELPRLSELAFYTEDLSSVKIDLFDYQGDPMDVDGGAAITKSFAMRMTRHLRETNPNRYGRVCHHIRTGQLTQLIFRMITPDGLIKVEATIVPDENLHRDGVQYDLRAASMNLKGELRSSGFILATGSNHEVHHGATWDEQSWINNRVLLPQSHMRRDLQTLRDDLVEIIQSGEMPDWLLIGENAHDESGVPDLEKLSQRMGHNYIRWQAAGLPVNAFQNFPYMAINGSTKKMEHHKHPVAGLAKHWTPMSNAFVGSIKTHSLATKVMGYKMESSDLLRWDPRIGLIMPDHRFRETFDLHGTWDLDDTVKVILVKVWSSDPDAVAMHKDGLTIDAQVAIPDEEDQAVLMAALVRSPNGAGEFSIEAIDETVLGGIMGFDMDLVTVVDLAKITKPQSVLLNAVTVSGLPSSLTYNRIALTREKAQAMILAQQSNPGIGRTANAFMTYSMSVNQTLPTTMVAVLGEQVDAVQQSADPVAFSAVEADVKNIYDQLIAAFNKDQTLLLDSHIAATRVPDWVRNQLQSRTVAGRLARYMDEYKGVIAEVRTMLKDESFKRRQETAIAQYVAALDFGTVAKEWARDFIKRNQSAISAVENQFNIAEMKNPFFKSTMQYEKMLAISAIIDSAVAELESHGDMAGQRALALYHYVLTGDRKVLPCGTVVSKIQDRVLVQPGTDKSIMDLIIRALAARGMAQPIE